MYTIGLVFTGRFMDSFGFRLPPEIEGMPFSDEKLNHFLQHFSTDMTRLKEMVADTQSYDQEYAYSFSPLRTYPLVQVVLDGQPALVAPIPTFLLRRFTEGVYYEICGVVGFSEAFGLLSKICGRCVG